MIPNGWTTALLDEVAERGSGHTPSKSHSDYWNGGIKWVSLADSASLDRGYIYETRKEISEKGLANSSAVLHSAGTVILSRDAGVGKSAILGAQMAVSQHFIAWECKKRGVLDSTFLYYWLQHMKPEFEAMAFGSTIKTIGLPYFKRLKITFPEIGEQRLISKLLARGDAAVSTAESLIAAKQKRKQALMQKLLTGKKRLPGFKKSWSQVKIGSVLAESRMPGSSGSSAKKLTVKLYGKGVIPRSEKIVGSDNTKYYRRKAGQFIYGKLDFLNGAFGIIPDALDGYESTLDLPAFDFLAGIAPNFFLQFVGQLRFYEQFAGAAAGGRKARRIQVDEFLNSSIELPELKEQVAISRILTAASREIELLEAKKSALEAQKKGLMSVLLTGKKRLKV